MRTLAREIELPEIEIATIANGFLLAGQGVTAPRAEVSRITQDRHSLLAPF